MSKSKRTRKKKKGREGLTYPFERILIEEGAMKAHDSGSDARPLHGRHVHFAWREGKREGEKGRDE